MSLAFAWKAKPLPGNGEAVAGQRLSLPGEFSYHSTPRRKRLQSLAAEARTLVLYEAPHRVRDTLEDCAAVFGGERGATVAREITKLHETVYRGPLRDLAARAQADADFGRGEIVLLVAGAPQEPAENEGGADGHGGALDRCLKILLAELPLKQAAHLAAQITETRANEAYKRALQLKNGA